MIDLPADDEQQARANLAAILRRARNGPYASLIADRANRRRQLYELLADSDDPLWKEIGTQLRDGKLRVRDLFEVEAYSAHLIETIDKQGREFPTVLAKAREQLEAEQEQPRGGSPRPRGRPSATR